MHLIGAFLLAVLIGGAGAVYASRAVDRIAGHGSPLAARAARAVQGRRKTVSIKAQEAWAQARSADWLERRRARRARRASGRGPGAAARRVRSFLPRTVLAGPPALVRAADQATAPAPVTDLTARREQRPPAQPAPGPQPAREQAPMPTDKHASGGEDMFTAMQQIVSHAMSGGLRSKQRAVTVLADAFDYISQQLATFARQLAEPGAGYGPPVWEPLQKAAAHQKAASSAAGESAAALQALANMQVGELADSPTRAPHQNELNSA